MTSNFRFFIHQYVCLNLLAYIPAYLHIYTYSEVTLSINLCKINSCFHQTVESLLYILKYCCKVTWCKTNNQTSSFHFFRSSEKCALLYILYPLQYITSVFLNIVPFFITSGNNTCPGEWKRFNDSCYQLSKSALPFDVARRKCNESASTLAEISTKEENEFVISKLTTKNSEIAWFGLQKSINSSTFRYLNSVPNYKAIGVFEPRIDTRASRCATVSIGTKDGVWISRDCELKFSYVCETAVRRGKLKQRSRFPYLEC